MGLGGLLITNVSLNPQSIPKVQFTSENGGMTNVMAKGS
jgi:hypothetical protein